MSARPFLRCAQRGFTLVEAVIVITIIGILGAIVAVFIRMPVQGYHDSVARAELTDIADLALRRMARDLRLALPNSIRVSPDGQAIEFLLTKAGGRYLAAEDGVGAHPVLDFLNAGNLEFTMIGALPAGKQAIVAGRDYVVVNNLGNDAPANAYGLDPLNKNIARITQVSSVGAGLQKVTMESNPFAAQNPPMPSPTSRFHIVSGAVTYYCIPGAGETGSLSRQWNYGINPAQAVPPVPLGRPASLDAEQTQFLATRVTACNFQYDTAASLRSALVRLTLELEMPDEGGRIKLVHQVHVDNTP